MTNEKGMKLINSIILNKIIYNKRKFSYGLYCESSCVNAINGIFYDKGSDEVIKEIFSVFAFDRDPIITTDILA